MIKQNKPLLFGSIIIMILLLLSWGAPFFSPYDPTMIDADNLLMPPSLKHPLGTDGLGRDLAARILYGGRISLSIGFLSVGIASCLGIFLGSLAGFYGGIIDSVIMRLVDVALCFPAFYLILAITAITGSSVFNIMLIIGLTSWMGPARLIRGEILSLKEREFIQAAQALGASTKRIIFRHLLPNAFGPILVNANLNIAGAIMVESSLSFLGLGVQPPTPSWGNILIESKSTLAVAWWLTVFPGLAILFTILGFNFIAEGIKKIN